MTHSNYTRNILNIEDENIIDSVKYFVVDIKKEIIQCYNKFENK